LFQVYIFSQLSSYFFDYLLCRYLDNEKIINLPKLEIQEKKDFIKFSVISSANNLISRLLYLIDTFLVGQILASSLLVAHYKTATILPANLIFISQSVILFIYPYIRKNADNISYVRNRYFQVIKKLAIVNFLITSLLYIYAPHVVRILFSEKYNDSVPALRIKC